MCVLAPTRTLAFVPGPHDADQRAQTPDRNLPPSAVLPTPQSKYATNFYFAQLLTPTMLNLLKKNMTLKLPTSPQMTMHVTGIRSNPQFAMAKTPVFAVEGVVCLVQPHADADHGDAAVPQQLAARDDAHGKSHVEHVDPAEKELLP